MRHFLSLLAVIGAVSVALSPGSASIAAQRHVLGTIVGKHTGTLVKHVGNRTYSFHFNSTGKLVSVSATGTAHGMTSTRNLTITSEKAGPPPGTAHKYYTVYQWCYYWVYDYYTGYYWRYWYYC